MSDSLTDDEKRLFEMIELAIWSFRVGDLISLLFKSGMNAGKVTEKQFNEDCDALRKSVFGDVAKGSNVLYLSLLMQQVSSMALALLLTEYLSASNKEETKTQTPEEFAESLTEFLKNIN